MMKSPVGRYPFSRFMASPSRTLCNFVGSDNFTAASLAHNSATQTWLTKTNCVAGHVGLELRNVVAKNCLEKSRRFPGNQPNSGHRDDSRLSCGVGETQLGPSARTQ